MPPVPRFPIPVLSVLALAVTLALSPLSVLGQQLPASDTDAVERLNSSPRHGEWALVPAGGGDELRAWIVYPERSDPAPVVVVIHEIFGLTDWIRAVADQLAAEGFIAIAPDLLSGMGPNGGGTESVDQQGATALIRELQRGDVNRRLQASAEYAMALPAAQNRVGSIGFCWGGTSSFVLASAWVGLDAAVVYYGESPTEEQLLTVRAPVLGLYAGDDARVNTTIDRAREMLDSGGIPFDVELYDGAGHGFLRQQGGRDGANLRASEAAWPRTIGFLRDML